MRITRLVLRDFRRYRELEIPLSPGLTVVHGPNEAGKTTIQRAIELVLTRKVTSNGGDIEALRPWDAGEDARPVVSLDFEIDDDERGTRSGKLEKAFRGAKGTVRLEVDGETITDPTLADQALAELTGIPSEAFFRSTASIRHHELADLDRDEAALRDRLQASISGADRGTSRARRILDRALYELNTKGAKNPGRLKVAEDAVEQERLAVEQGELALAQLERDRETVAGTRERRTETEAGLAERRSVLEKARQAERLQAERVSSQERYERYRQAVTVSEELIALRDTHPSANPLPVLEQIVTRLRALDAKIRELQALLSGEVAVSFEVPPPPTWRPLSRIAIGLVVIGLLVAAASVAARIAGVVDLGSPPALVGGVAAGIGFILAFVAWWLRRSDRVHQEMRDVEIDRRLRGRSEMEAELRQAQADTKQQLAGLGLADLAAAEALLTAEQEHVARIERLGAQLDGLVGKEPPEALPGQRDAAALEVEQKTAALEVSGPSPRSPGPASAWKSRSATSKPRSSGRGTTRPTRVPAWRPTRSTPSRSPVTPSVSPPGAISSPRSSARRASTIGRSARSRRPSRRRCGPRHASSSSAWSAISNGSPLVDIVVRRSTTRPSTSDCSRLRRATGSTFGP